MILKKYLNVAILVAVILTSCTLQKRHYRNGFYVHHSSDQVKVKESKEQEVVPLPGISSRHLEEPITASSDDQLILLPKEIPEDSITDICNDSIWTREGVVSRVKVLEVTQTEIKYKRCANINGPTIVVSQHNISKVKYANGITESYQDIKKNLSAGKTTIPVASQNQKPAFDIGNIAGICGLIFIACGIIALVALYTQFYPLFALFMVLGAFSYFATWISSVLALAKIKRLPDKYKGSGKALAALIVVAVYTALVLALVLVITRF